MAKATTAKAAAPKAAAAKPAAKPAEAKLSTGEEVRDPPKTGDEEEQSGGAVTADKATTTDKPNVDEAEPTEDKPNVSGPGGDGATMQPAVGTSREMADKLSTKEGAAPIGVEKDQGFAVENEGNGARSHQEAALTGTAPAGVVLAGPVVTEVNEGVQTAIREFAGLTADADDGSFKAIFATSNIHDDLGIQRADIIHFAAALERKFGIDITPSEAQNFLLVRDVTNLVLRKLAKNDQRG